MDIKNAYNFKQVNGLVSCSGTLQKVDLQSLSDAAYQSVINLLPDDNEYVIDGEKEKFENMGIQYVYIPVEWNEPKQSDFDAFAAAMDEFKDRKLHIHCAANYRVTAFYAIYAFKTLGWSQAESREFIATIWQLSDYPVWNKFVSGYIGY